MVVVVVVVGGSLLAPLHPHHLRDQFLMEPPSMSIFMAATGGTVAGAGDGEGGGCGGGGADTRVVAFSRFVLPLLGARKIGALWRLLASLFKLLFRRVKADGAGKGCELR